MRSGCLTNYSIPSLKRAGMVRDPLPDAARTRVDPTSIDGEKSAEDSAQAGNSFGSPDAEACIVFCRLVRPDRAVPIQNGAAPPMVVRCISRRCGMS
jgi:hypothetical protein